MEQNLEIWIDFDWIQPIIVEFRNDAILFAKQKYTVKRREKNDGFKQKSNKNRMTNEMIDDLIQLDEDREVIFNVKSKEYSEKDKRRNAVNKICDSLEISGKYP